MSNVIHIHTREEVKVVTGHSGPMSLRALAYRFGLPLYVKPIADVEGPIGLMIARGTPVTIQEPGYYLQDGALLAVKDNRDAYVVSSIDAVWELAAGHALLNSRQFRGEEP